MDSLITGNISAKAARVNPFHVLGHQPPKIYTNIPITTDQLEMLIAARAPAIPHSSLYTKIQESTKWNTNDVADSHPTTRFLSWACRYIWMVRLKTKLYKKGMHQREIFPATAAMSACSPSSFKRGVVKKKRGSIIVAVMKSTIHERCKYIPIMWYCFAPNACPHRVSVALDMPSCS